MSLSCQQSPAGLDNWLEFCRDYIARYDQSLLSIYDVYAEETRYGFSFICQDLIQLKRGAKILEIGSGIMTLSCYLKKLGFNVTALEPYAEGFSHMDKLRCLVLDCAKEKNLMPDISSIKAEDLQSDSVFKYIFSVNVMEHVENVEKVLNNIYRALSVDGKYHFTCPNYLFPYEPHFNIPILFSKSITRWLFKKKIDSYTFVDDPTGLWNSLNWITTSQLLKCVDNLPSSSYYINKQVTTVLFERSLIDKKFAARRSFLMRKFIYLVVKLKLHYVFRMAPVVMHPAIDCYITKLSKI